MKYYFPLSTSTSALLILTLLTLVFVPYSRAAGLVAAYSFDEGSGTISSDQSGRGHSATLSNATWSTAGHTSGAVSMNGTNALITVADAADLRLANAMTIEAWVKPSSLAGWRTVIMKEKPGGLSYVLYASDNNAPPALYGNSGGNDVAAVGSGLLTLNGWSHLAGSYDGSTLRVYVNGSLVGSKAMSGSLVASTSPLRIGGNSIWGEYFSGLIDDVRVYDRTLSDAEILTDMNTPVALAGPDTAPPSVISNSPDNNASGVALGTTITATFNEAIDPSTLGVATFELRNSSNNLVSATVNYNAVTNSATLTPSSTLVGATTYTAILKGGANDPRVKDIAGNPLTTTVTWSFTTTAGSSGPDKGEWGPKITFTTVPVAAAVLPVQPSRQVVDLVIVGPL